MKKVIFASMAVATLFAACTNDEVVYENNDANVIRFNAVAENNTRAADVYCNANMPGEFRVSAAHDSKFYIQGDLIQQDNYGRWNNVSGLRYWPNDGMVTFYGYYNDNDKFAWADATKAPTFNNFIVEEDVADQVDLLYARKSQEKVPAASKEEAAPTPQTVTLNFRHALSQIVFNAKNTNPNLYVEIEGVSVVNVKGQGTYTLPMADTEDNINCDPAETADYYESTRGKWALPDQTLSSYSVEFDAVPLTGAKDADVVSLTSANTVENDFPLTYSKKAMLLLPQETTAYNPETEANWKTTENSYFLVKCRIWNVSGETVDKDNDVVLWGEDGAEDVLLPVKFNWEEGKKYIYTFVFGNGNGGFDPDPEDPTPDPVLVPITFDITVDAFIPVNAGEIETGVQNNNTGK